MAEDLAAAKNIIIDPIQLNLDCTDEENEEPPPPDELSSGKLRLATLTEGTGGMLFDLSRSGIRTGSISREFIKDLS